MFFLGLIGGDVMRFRDCLTDEEKAQLVDELVDVGAVRVDKSSRDMLVETSGSLGNKGLEDTKIKI